MSATADPSSPSPSLPAPLPMPSAMTYTSLDWMARSGAAGVPLLAAETPPTSPEKVRSLHRRGGSGSRSGSAEETPEQRQKRQEAFRREKAAELAALLERKAAGKLQELEAKQAVEQEQEAPSTPLRQPRPSAAALAAEAAAADSAEAKLVSPEKRRAKKLSSLQYPLFSVCWWDPAAAASSATGAAAAAASHSPSSAAIAKAAESSSKREGKGEHDSLGLVLLGGGGGKKGAGIDSGLLVCNVLPASAPVFASGNSPIRFSAASNKSMLLHPTAFLDSHDFLIGSVVPHPQLPVLAATVGAGTAILEAVPADPVAAADTSAGAGPPPPTLVYRDLVQTDFSKELSAQAQAWAPSGRWFVTGGEDRILRAWSYPGLELLAILGAGPDGTPLAGTQHRLGVLSLDVNYDGSRVASCAGDSFVKIWNTSRLEGVEGDDADANAAGGEVDDDEDLNEVEEEREKTDAAWAAATLKRCPLVRDISVAAIKGSLLKFQAARFFGKERVIRPAAAAAASSSSSPEEEEKEEEPFGEMSTPSSPEHLLAIVSHIRRGGPGSSSLIKFSVEDDAYARVKQVSTGSAALTCMEVSDDPHSPLVAVANTDGQVAVYRAETMACIQRVNKVHDLPTTCMAFSPSSLHDPSSSSSSLHSSRWLVSASADKSVALIELQSPEARSRTRTVVFFALAILLLVIAIALGKEPWNLPESDL